MDILVHQVIYFKPSYAAWISNVSSALFLCIKAVNDSSHVYIFCNAIFYWESFSSIFLCYSQRSFCLRITLHAPQRNHHNFPIYIIIVTVTGIVHEDAIGSICLCCLCHFSSIAIPTVIVVSVNFGILHPSSYQSCE